MCCIALSFALEGAAGLAAALAAGAAPFAGGSAAHAAPATATASATGISRFIGGLLTCGGVVRAPRGSPPGGGPRRGSGRGP
uniref:Secreted protein n=1 Tax=Eiseniibacteriota bacterium TaxID=2212470 RepID=A0A832MNQ8_UNCEI